MQKKKKTFYQESIKFLRGEIEIKVYQKNKKIQYTLNGEKISKKLFILIKNQITHRATLELYHLKTNFK